ncbi:MAG: IMPACT family protein [Pseudoclavibacter sp.]
MSSLSSPPAGPIRYGVLARPADHEIEIKRSRFLCRVRRVESEDAAREVIAEARADHRLARHHCSAFVLGADRRVRRSNDDGEPAGTAGTPMLDALAQHATGLGGDAGPGDASLSDAVAVVIRYFGGVLLGAGGLVRAYSESVSGTLDRSMFLARERRRILALDAPHADAGRWENELRASGVVVLESEYGGQGVRLRLAVSATERAIADLEARIAALTQGGRALEPLGDEWVDVAPRAH